MVSIILCLGMMFIILSINAYGVAGELKLLGFLEEAQQLFSLSVHLAFLGFSLIILSYPKLAKIPPFSSKELFY